MSETRIRRGGTSRLGASGGRSRGRANGRTRAEPPGLFGRMADALSIAPRSLRRALLWGGGLVAAGVLWPLTSFFGLPGAARMEIAELAAKAGFQVQKVEVHGSHRMDETAVYDIALGAVDRSMLNVDLDALRARILKLGWVRDARISRRLPDTLVVDIVEREPAAVWQLDRQLVLIDMSGAVLDPVSASAMPDLPLLVGPNANRQTARLNALIDNAPALKPLIAGATWVGNRRWDLRFQSGETLLLPEGGAATAALVNFARMDGINRLLGRGIVRFDMRDPDKFVMRLPSGKKDAAGAGGDENRDEGGKADDGKAGQGRTPAGPDKTTVLVPSGARAGGHGAKEA